MAKKTNPRHGSMGVWPRVRAKRKAPKIRNFAESNEAKPLAFPTYKAGMTHVLATGFAKQERSKNTRVQVPVTVLECPPMKIATARCYVEEYDGTQRVSKQLDFPVNKELHRSIKHAKKDHASKEDVEEINADEYVDIRVEVYTNPKAAGLKKTPELFELQLGGTNAEKLEFIKEHINTPIRITDIFGEGELVDVHGITKGKGTQGPVRRFGITLRSHKSEKSRRNPGSLGGWIAQGKTMYRIAHAGQTGYHQRVQYNNLVMRIGDNPDDVNVAGGFKHYGDITTDYLIIKGSVPGPAKRLITLTKPVRAPKNTPNYDADQIKYVSQTSKQGN